MKVEVLHPLKEYQYFWATLLVQLPEEEYLIEFEYTVAGSTRITLREVGDYGLLCNWCCGPDKLWTMIALNAMLSFLKENDGKALPFCSDIKPYYNDPDFFGKLLPYLAEIFFTQPTELLPTPETQKTTEQIDYEAATKKGYPTFQ